MKNNFYQKVLKRVVMFVAPLVFLLSIMSFAQAQEYTVELEDYNLSVWDLSGSYNGIYSSYMDITLDMRVTITQDSYGKVIGSGYIDINALGYHFDLPVEIKGTVKGKDNIVTLKFSLQGDGNFSLYGENIYIKMKEKGTLVINQAAAIMSGTAKAKMCAKGAGVSGCDKTQEIQLDLGVPFGMTGEALLSIDATLDESGKKLEGPAELTLSNGDFYPLSAKGKYNSNQDETKFSLKGSVEASKKVKFKLKINEGNGNSTFISGKALGQKLKFKQK